MIAERGIDGSLFERFARVAAEQADRPAVIDGDRVIPYSELHRRVLATASQMSQAGVAKGDRVGILLPNSLEFVIGYFAILGCGGIVVPLNDQYQSKELRYFFEACKIRMILCAEESVPLCKSVAQECVVKPLIIPANPDSGFFAVDEGSASGFTPAKVLMEEPLMIQFSSGSTGIPKRISRTHANLLFELDSLEATLGVCPEDRFLGVAPFSHVNGLVRSMLTSICCGATLFPLAKYERQRVIRVIEQQRITVCIAVPFMFSMLALMNVREKPDFSSLRLCISASAPMPENLNRNFEARFGRYVRQLYGSTETGTISVNLSSKIEASLKTVGTPIRGVEVEVFSDAGDLLAPGQTGELAVRSPGVVRAYEDLPEVNRDAFRGGFFFTGDLGTKSSDGQISLLGRKKFFINKGGYKINPADIEEVLESHPDVLEVAVVGVPTAMGDEKVKAVVVSRGECDEASLVDHCRGKIADFKIPSVIEFRESLPKTSTGKIRKTLLVD